MSFLFNPDVPSSSFGLLRLFYLFFFFSRRNHRSFELLCCPCSSAPTSSWMLSPKAVVRNGGGTFQCSPFFVFPGNFGSNTLTMVIHILREECMSCKQYYTSRTSVAFLLLPFIFPLRLTLGLVDGVVIM